MRKVFVNGTSAPADVRTLSPFAYKDPIKTLDKSNEARVSLDGNDCFRSCVTSGRDVKNANGGLKFHLYFYMTKEAAQTRDTARREFLPISQEEYRAYREDPAHKVVLISANLPTAPETEVVDATTLVSEEAAAEVEQETEVVPEVAAEVEQETEVVPAEEPRNEGTKRARRRK
jgi:hypothetical protein